MFNIDGSFVRFNDGVLYNPIFDSNIFSIEEGGLLKEFYVDFAEMTLPEGFRKGLGLDRDRFHNDFRLNYSFFTMYETADNIVAMTIYSRGRERVLYYSTLTGNTIVSHPLAPSPEIPYLRRLLGVYEDHFVTEFRATELIDLAEQGRENPDIPGFESLE